MSAAEHEPPGADLVGAAEAASILEVTPDRVKVLVEEGLLSPAGGGAGGESRDEPRFVRAEVVALREIGG